MNRFSDDLLVALRSHVIEVKPILFKSKPGLTRSHYMYICMYVKINLYNFKKHSLVKHTRQQISLKRSLITIRSRIYKLYIITTDITTAVN